MLSVEDLTLRFGERPLLGGVSFRLQERERVALAGRNGQGKSTLFRVLSGEVAPESGSVNLAKGRTVGYLPQDVLAKLGGHTPLEGVLSGRPALAELEAEILRLSEELSHRHDDPALLRALGQAQARFEGMDGYAAEARARTILDGLGFSQERMTWPLERLSGGWLMRVHLGRLLWMQPDLLLLDEPTNHLDLETREWLLEFLQQFPGAVLLTSHDRYFLDALVQRVLELESGRLEVYHGNYSTFEQDKAARLDRLKAAWARQQRELKAQQEFIDRNRANASTASNVQSRIKQLARIERIELPPEAPKVRLRFPEPPRGSAVAMRATGLGRRYDALTVFQGLDLELEAGTRLVVVGVNGAGKSTFLKLVAGRLEPSEGRLDLGHNVSLQYFSQYEDDVADTGASLLQVMEASAPKELAVPPRTVLGCFLFSGDDVYKPVRVLSGGERARLKIARMLLQPSNLLVLDEPTNHLDIHSQGVLLQALQEFKGTLVFVSHDRQFISRLATAVLELDGGQPTLYPCDYETYRWRKAQAAQAAAQAAQAPSPSRLPAREAPPREAGNNEREEARQRQRATKRLERQTEELQATLERQEARLAELEQAMSAPGFFASPEQSRPVLEEHKALRAEIDAGYDALEQALQELEALQAAGG